MQEIPRKNGRDYSNFFLAVVLLGLVVMVVGLMMATARSQSVRSKPQNPAFSIRGHVSNAG
ncbi:MAG: hypothetical protein EKK40_03300 [Bradyrhizobiaceae bacterium]|nr:MAG: hypothetical protein EKK40_03300 [Bradyrhizobiaceae bacterium]